MKNDILTINARLHDFNLYVTSYYTKQGLLFTFNKQGELLNIKHRDNLDKVNAISLSDDTTIIGNLTYFKQDII